MLFSFARKSPQKELARAVNLYFSEDAVVVAAMHVNAAGIYFEQAVATRLEVPLSAMNLGLAFRHAFNAFGPLEADLREWNKRDWPAFKASGLRSVKQFEDRFRPVTCCGVTPSNMSVCASTPHPRDSVVELSLTFNPLSPPEVIGEHLQRLIAVAAST